MHLRGRGGGSIAKYILSGWSVADLGGGTPVHAPLAAKMFSISCSFGENVIKLYPCTPPSEGWHPCENPRSATGGAMPYKGSQYTLFLCLQNNKHD